MSKVGLVVVSAVREAMRAPRGRGVFALVIFVVPSVAVARALDGPRLSGEARVPDQPLARRRAMRRLRAMIVSVGLKPPDDRKTEPSVT